MKRQTKLPYLHGRWDLLWVQPKSFFNSTEHFHLTSGAWTWLPPYKKWPKLPILYADAFEKNAEKFSTLQWRCLLQHICMGFLNIWKPGHPKSWTNSDCTCTSQMQPECARLTVHALSNWQCITTKMQASHFWAGSSQFRNVYVYVFLLHVTQPQFCNASSIPCLDEICLFPVYRDKIVTVKQLTQSMCFESLCAFWWFVRLVCLGFFYYLALFFLTEKKKRAKNSNQKYQTYLPSYAAEMDLRVQ